MRRILLLLAATAALASAQSSDLKVYIGTYTNQGSKGIYLARLNTATGALSAPELAAEIPNPTFLTIHPSSKYLYAANEIGNYNGQRSGSVSAFSIDPSTGKLTPLNAVSSKGQGPCHVSTDAKGRFCFAANYGGGTVASYAIGADGKLSDAVSAIQHEGKGANPKRQERPHAHSINTSPDGRFAIAADLGIDELIVYAVDQKTGALTRHSSVKTAPGAGPRHFDFHPRLARAYAINELSCTVAAYDWDAKAGSLKELAAVSTLPAGLVVPNNSTAEVRVHPSGRFLYGSNRGHDSIALFALDSKGLPTFVETVSSGGVMPRNFNIDPSGRWLLAANQRTGNVVVFSIDPKTGRLKDTGNKIEVNGAVCLRFLGK